jgi:hypothetical protein
MENKQAKAITTFIKPRANCRDSTDTGLPPMLFRYKGKLHKNIKADGPERIEQECGLQQGQHRDYYCVEDEDGCRYWLFRSGHYKTDRSINGSYTWFFSVKCFCAYELCGTTGDN